MIDAAAVDRFRRDLTALAPVPSAAAPLALAVSGGPDSVAMLALAAAAFPGAVTVATVDHRLREESAADAALVAETCAVLEVSHATLLPDVPIAGASIQAQARGVRYALLAAWSARAGAVAIATAHHVDDQAETFLMRAARGSGLSGLAGIRGRATIAAATIVRPLLGWRRAELRAIVRRAGLAFVEDPANADPRHDRTRFRALLAANEWLDPPALAQAAAQLAEADADLAATAEWLWESRAEVTDAHVAIEAAGLPRDLQRRLVRRAIGAVRAAVAMDAPPWNPSANVEPVIDALAAGRRVTQAGVIGSVSRGRWRFREAPPRRVN